MKKLLALLSVVLFSNSIWAGNIEFKVMKFNNLGMTGRMIRLSDNGIFLDDAGMHLEGTLTLKVTGMRGQRLICVLSPLDSEGNLLADRRGELCNLTAFKVNSDASTIELPVEVPYTWINTKERELSLNFNVTIVNSKVEEVAQKVIQVAPENVNVNSNDLPSKMMGDIFGGGDGDGGDMLGGLLGGLFGGSDATSEHICSACDGTGLCSNCYGDAFFDPSQCRRCAQDPGICRRCKGAKKEKVDIDINRY
jgi:hypothetical protein